VLNAARVLAARLDRLSRAPAALVSQISDDADDVWAAFLDDDLALIDGRH
jgi:hypothetical protein